MAVMVASSRSRFAWWQRGIFDPEVDERPAAHQVLLDAARKACHLEWRKLRPGVVFYTRGAAWSWDATLRFAASVVSDGNNVARWRSACSNMVKCDRCFDALTAIVTSFHLNTQTSRCAQRREQTANHCFSPKARRALLALGRKHEVLDLGRLVSSFSKKSALTH